MRSRISVLFALVISTVLAGTEAGPPSDPWLAILSSVGLQASGLKYRVLHAGAAAPSDWDEFLSSGGVLFLEGESEVTRALGFRTTAKKAQVRSIVDSHNANLPILWETPVDVFRMEPPAGATVFAHERWTGAPVTVGFKKRAGAALWLATGPGQPSYSRYPYVLQALYDLGVRPGWRANRLWAFFDWSYRTRADSDYLAAQWRNAGIAGLHIAAWHFNEPDPDRDEYLRKLIDACHRHGIVAYAWLELPHVSEKFWDDHPKWRERTALQQDAQLDWRRLMNLQNQDCFSAAVKAVHDLINRFDWDGVNLAELYFDSLEGADNPARFTPFNDDVRRVFKQRFGSDPVDVIRSKDARLLRSFLDFRAELARTMQQQWIDDIEALRSAGKPWLDLVLTHVDDKLEPEMRDRIAADSSGMLRLASARDLTFMVEDPATLWNRGPERYSQIAARYAPEISDPGRLAIDINVVDRYQDVYPTKKQTGTELFQLIHTASAAFSRVAVYFESSILKVDSELLPFSAATVSKFERSRDGAITIDSASPVGLVWKGGALVDGKPWPVFDRDVVSLPAGRHVITAMRSEPALVITDFNGELKGARTLADGVEIAYASQSRAIALTSKTPTRLEIDGQPFAKENIQGPVCFLPKGNHTARLYVQ